MERREDGVFAAVVHRSRAPSRFIFPLLGIEIAFPYVTLYDWSKVPAERVRRCVNLGRSGRMGLRVGQSA
ncbi:MAG: hypothetical protein GIW99_11660 [Candidatus Eremiobacteraeota bacterium]|nr:hypothetical protein [Candidatus Eremiobacteraeota bacterium]